MVYLFNVKYFVYSSQVKGFKESHIKVYNCYFLSISEIYTLYSFHFASSCKVFSPLLFQMLVPYKADVREL